MAEFPLFTVIHQVHLDGARDLVGRAIDVARAHKSQDAADLAHAAMAHYELLVLQAQAERKAVVEDYRQRHGLGVRAGEPVDDSPA